MKKKSYLFIILLNTIATNCFANNFAKLSYKDSSVILIPFTFKQSTLFSADTYEVIDSVANLLMKDKDITLTISGYAHRDEGSDTICHYLSLNRALFVRDYILGRGVKPDRIALVQGLGIAKSITGNIDFKGRVLNSRVELKLTFAPEEVITDGDRDGDGIANEDDDCPDVFGYKENNGCPDKDVILIPFQSQGAWLTNYTYAALDSVIAVLKQNTSYKIIIEGHAYKTEGNNTFCQKLAGERVEMVKRYLSSRFINADRIVETKNFASSRPYNAGKNPKEIATNCRAQIFIKK